MVAGVFVRFLVLDMLQGEGLLCLPPVRGSICRSNVVCAVGYS